MGLLASESSVIGVTPMILHCGAENAAPSQKWQGGPFFITNSVYIPCAHNNNKSHFVPAERELKGRISYMVRFIYESNHLRGRERRGIEPLSFSAALCVWNMEIRVVRSPRFLWHQHIANHYFLLFALALFGFISYISISLSWAGAAFSALIYAALSFSAAGARARAYSIRRKRRKIK